MPEQPSLSRAERALPLPSATAAIVAGIVAVFLLQNLADALSLFPIYRDFALSLDGLRHFQFWQLITFQFLHVRLADGGIFHLLGNVFAICLCGPAVEKSLGKLRLLALYLLAGTAGGLLQMTGAFFAPDRFGTAVVGGSAGACALLAALATFFPTRRLHFFFLPVSIRADHFFALAVIATIAGLFLPSAHVAHGAHLGGLFIGFFAARNFARSRPVLAPVPNLAKTTLPPTAPANYP